jgi:predicted ATP-grasp superfamily ATP-dependent carboligase
MTAERTAERVAVVGASTRAAAGSLLRAGYQVSAADLFADADLKLRCPVTQIADYPAGLLPWLESTECRRWIYTGALENYPELVEPMAAVKPLWGHPGHVLRRVRNPLWLQEALLAGGFDFPETVWAAAPPGDGRWLAKTYRGSSGSGVSTTSDEGPCYWQRFVEGVPLAAVYAGSELLGVTRQLVGEPWCGAAEFRYCGSIGPWSLPASATSILARLGKTLYETFDLTHLVGVDFVLDEQRLWILEVNPRYTASVEIVERVHGLNAFTEIAPGASRGDPALARGAIENSYGKAILFAKQPLAISPQRTAALLAEAGNVDWPHLADIPPGGTHIDTHEPVLTVFASGETAESVEAELKRRAEEIEQRLYGE